MLPTSGVESLSLHHHQKIPRCLFAVALMARSPLQTRADMIAFSVSSNTAVVFGDSVTLRYSFTLSSAVNVTNLGLLDALNDGFATSHAVSILTSTGTQLVQAAIPAGTGETLINGFRYVSITPFTSPQALIQSAASTPP